MLEFSRPRPYTACVTLDKLPNLSEHQIPRRRQIRIRAARGNVGRLKHDHTDKPRRDVFLAHGERPLQGSSFDPTDAPPPAQVKPGLVTEAERPTSPA